MTDARRMAASRGKQVTLTYEGTPIIAYEGETLAVALLAAGVPAFALTREGHPRLPFCNMGTCFDCSVTIDGRRLVRACLTDVRDGMRVTQHRAS